MVYTVVRLKPAWVCGKFSLVIIADPPVAVPATFNVRLLLLVEPTANRLVVSGNLNVVASDPYVFPIMLYNDEYVVLDRFRPSHGKNFADNLVTSFHPHINIVPIAGKALLCVVTFVLYSVVLNTILFPFILIDDIN